MYRNLYLMQKAEKAYKITQLDLGGICQHLNCKRHRSYLKILINSLGLDPTT